MRQPPKKPVANDYGREVRSLKSRFKVQPLGYMLEVINNDKLPIEFRCAMAEAAAPYLHPLQRWKSTTLLVLRNLVS